MDPLLEFSIRASRGLHRRLQTFAIRRELRKRNLSHAPAIQTFTVRDELEALFRLARECPADGRVLEIGSYLGASTCYIGAGLRGPRASIVCIDTWNNETMPEGTRETYAEFMTNVRPISDQLTLVRKRSDQVKAGELTGNFDLIFLDGDHSYAQTRADFASFSRLLTPEGTLAFHDSLFFEGVSRVVGEALGSAQWKLGGIARNMCWLKRATFQHSS